MTLLPLEKYMRHSYLFVALIATSGITLAGQTEIKAAESIATVISIHEKCTGDAPSPAKMDRIVRTMLAAGMTPQDFKTGSQRATSQIQRMYPGSARPSQNTCVEAEKLYKEAFGSM